MVFEVTVKPLILQYSNTALTTSLHTVNCVFTEEQDQDAILLYVIVTEGMPIL